MASINFPSSPIQDDTHTDLNGQVWIYDGKRWHMTSFDNSVHDTPVNGATTDPISSNWAFDNNAITIKKDGSVSMTGKLDSTLVTGTAPFSVLSTTKVTNLNADQIDGLDSAELGRLATSSEWTATQNFNATTLTDGATINWNLETNQVCSVTLAGNRTMAAPTNIIDGGMYTITVIQDATGARTLTWNAAFQWASGGTPPTLSAAANAKDIFIFRASATVLFEMGRSLNVS